MTIPEPYPFTGATDIHGHPIKDGDFVKAYVISRVTEREVWSEELQMTIAYGKDPAKCPHDPDKALFVGTVAWSDYDLRWYVNIERDLVDDRFAAVTASLSRCEYAYEVLPQESRAEYLPTVEMGLSQ